MSQTVFLSRFCAVFNHVLREGFGSMSAPVVIPSGRHSQTAGQSEYEEDQEEQAEQPAGAISPIGAMRPRGQYPQEQENQHNDQNGTHLISPLSALPPK